MTPFSLFMVSAYVGTIGILLAYARGNRRSFDFCNACAAPSLVLVGVLSHAYPNAVISGAFGLIAGWNLLSDWRLARRKPAPLAPWQVPFIESPNVPEGQMLLINRDNLKFEPVIFDDITGNAPFEETWDWYVEKMYQDGRKTDGRIVLFGTHKEDTDG